MNKVLKFLISIAVTFSITSCGLLGGLEETDEDSGNSGFDFGDTGLGTTEDTTPASNNTPSSETPSSGGEQETPHSETVYRINFYNGGSHLGYLDLKEGTKVTKDTYTTIPTYPSPKTGYDYTFIGWNETRQNNEIGNAVTYTVSKNANLHAVYSQTAKQYTVNFKYGTTDLGSQGFPYGTLIGTNNTYTYDNKLTKTEEGKTYTFIGWNKDRQNNDVGEAKTYTVTSNLTLFAVFSSETQKYSVTFINEGATLGSKDFVYGSKIEKGNKYQFDFSKTSTAQYSYTFDGWNESSGASSGVEYTVTSNMTVHAIYTSTTRQYLVTFMNGSTTLKEPTSVNYGVRPTAPNNPTKDEEKNNSTGIKYTYTFAGWSTDSTASAGANNVYASNNIPVATKDDTYYAIFSKTTYYLVTFYNGTTALTSDYYVESGKKPTYSGTTPSKSGSGVTYTFIGWNESSTATSGTLTANLPVVSKKTNYYAIFSSTSTGGGSGGSDSETPEEGSIDTFDYVELYGSNYNKSYNAFGNKITIPYGNSNTSKYDITCSLDGGGFTINNADDSVTITANSKSEISYLNVQYKNKGTTTVAKTHTITLLSLTLDCTLSSFTDTQLGEYPIPEGEYVHYEFDGLYNSGSSDLVIPSKVYYNGSIKKVASVSFDPTRNTYVRNLYFPNTVFHIGVIYRLRVKDFIRFPQNELGFIFIEKKSIYQSSESGTNYFVGSDSNDTVLMDSSKYNFPYTKMGLSSSKTWNKGDVTYSDWDWATTLSTKKQEGSLNDYLASLENSYMCFRN